MVKKKSILVDEENILTFKSFYELLEKRDEKILSAIIKVDEKVEAVQQNVANINGRIMIIPTLIATAVSAFFFVMNLVLKQ